MKKRLLLIAVVLLCSMVACNKGKDPIPHGTTVVNDYDTIPPGDSTWGDFF